MLGIPLITLAVLSIQPPSPRLELAVRVGASPSELAACGVTASALVTAAAASNADPDQSQALVQATAHVQQALANLTLAEKSLEQEPGNQARHAALQNARSVLRQRLTEYRAAAERLAEAAFPDAAPGLEAVRLVSPHGRGTTPPSMRLGCSGDHSELRVAIALRSERRAQRTGRPVPTHHAAQLSRIRALPAVVGAQAAVDREVAAIQQVLQQ